MVAKFSDQPVDLSPQKVVASALIHLENLVESHILHVEMLSIIPDDRDTKVRKLHVDVRGIQLTNNPLTNENRIWERMRIQ